MCVVLTQYQHFTFKISYYQYQYIATPLPVTFWTLNHQPISAPVSIKTRIHHEKAENVKTYTCIHVECSGTAHFSVIRLPTFDMH